MSNQIDNLIAGMKMAQATGHINGDTSCMFAIKLFTEVAKNINHEISNKEAVEALAMTLGMLINFLRKDRVGASIITAHMAELVMSIATSEQGLLDFLKGDSP